VYLHRRGVTVGGFTTIPEHMPKAHRAHLEWSPSRLIHWGATIGPLTAALVSAILEQRQHPEQGYRSCLGLLRLSKRYTPERLEAACARALRAGARSYRHVESILKHGLDRAPIPAETTSLPLPLHDNVRGPDYYTTPKGQPV
jgi:transposase